MNHFRLPQFLKKFINLDFRDRDVPKAIKSDQILCLASAEEGKDSILRWHFKNGQLKKARTVKVIDKTYVIIEERGLLTSRASLININEVSSVSFYSRH